MPLTLRSTKGSPLTHAELDGNFTFLSGSTSASYAASASYALTSSFSVFATNANLAAFSNVSSNSSAAGFATTAASATSASYAETASYAITSSYVLSSSFATTASYALNAPIINTGSFATTGSNRFIGNQTTTGSLTINSSVGPVLTVNASLTSSISSSNEPITPTFNGTITFIPQNGANGTWNSDIWIYYSAVSGSQHTQVSSVSTNTGNGNAYNAFRVFLDNGITLSPVGSIDDGNYTIWIYNSANSTYYKKDNQSLTFLQTTGLTITLTGNTTTNFSTDLTTAGFSSTTDPVANYPNTLTYVSSSLVPSTPSLVTINSPLIINSVSGSRISPTSSGVPTFNGLDGQFVFGTTGGEYYIYTWMSNAWRSGSLV